MANTNLTEIKPGSKAIGSFLLEIYHYRELLLNLSLKDIKVKYAQTYIGLLWSFVNPIFTVLILSFVFGKLMQTNSQGIPKPLFTLLGMIGWTYFSSVLQKSGSSLISNQNMIKKVYFPRIILPVSQAVSSLVNFAIVLSCSLVAMIIYSTPVSINIVFFPGVVILIMCASLGFGIWISAITIKYRDLQHMVPIVLRLGMFITPIAYSSKEVPKEYLFFYYLNPMAGATDLVRWSLLDIPIGYKIEYVMISVVVAVLIFLSSLLVFKKIEYNVADII